MNKSVSNSSETASVVVASPPPLLFNLFCRDIARNGDKKKRKQSKEANHGRDMQPMAREKESDDGRRWRKRKEMLRVFLERRREWGKTHLGHETSWAYSMFLLIIFLLFLLYVFVLFFCYYYIIGLELG